MIITKKLIKSIFDEYCDKGIHPESQNDLRVKSDFTSESIMEMWRWIQSYPEELALQDLTELIFTIIKQAELYANEIWQKSVTKFEIALASEHIFNEKKIKPLNLF